MFASRAIGITFILALTSLCVLAQTSPQASATPETSGPPSTGSITGQVVDENGQPLKGVTVQIRADASSEAQTVGTDREGQFQVNGLAPLAYTFYLTMPAYFPDYGKGPGKYHIGDRVTLIMNKGGVVTGKVTDANGDPVVMVKVHAQRVRDSYGRPVNGWVEARATDDRGVYRIYGLRAGTYVVFAGGPGRLRGLYRDSVFDFDVPTYAPSSTRETAAEIDVRLGGEVTDVDIRYRNEQGRVVSGDVAVPAKTHRSFAVMLTKGGEAGQYGETFYQSEDKRTFVFKGVADGDYSLVAQSFDPEGETALSESKQVTVQGADVTGIQLTTKLLGSVSGRVVLDETKLAECTNKESPLSTETSVFAWPRNEESAKQTAQFIRLKEPGRPDDKGNFLLQNLPPGAYYFAPSLKARQWYVHSITFASPANATTKAKSVDATRIWTNIKNGDHLSGLTIALAQGGASLRGELVLAPGERLPAGAFLYLVPAEREKANDVLRFFATSLGPNGYFELNNIAPGRYWIVAQMAGENSGGLSPNVRLPHETEKRVQIRREAETAKIEIEFKPCQEIVGFRLPLRPPGE